MSTYIAPHLSGIIQRAFLLLSEKMWYALTITDEFTLTVNVAISLDVFQYSTILLKLGILKKYGNGTKIIGTHLNYLKHVLLGNFIIHTTTTRVF